MGFDEDWNSNQRDQEELLRQVESAANMAETVVWGLIIGTFFGFLLVIAITYYCYKKKRVTPGFVIRPPPGTGYTPLAPGYPTGTPGYPAAAPGYPAGAPAGYPTGAPGYPADTAAYTPGYPAGAPAYPAGAPAYPAGAPGYQAGAPGYPTGAPGYPTEKSAQPPAYNSGNFTQS